jgi:hypothetical protein
VRNPLNIHRGRESFDWSVKIQVAGGSLAETSDLYPYEAPETGYVSSFVFEVKKDTPKWTQRLTREFYIHTAKGDYGRITVDLTTTPAEIHPRVPRIFSSRGNSEKPQRQWIYLYWIMLSLAAGEPIPWAVHTIVSGKPVCFSVHLTAFTCNYIVLT